MEYSDEDMDYDPDNEESDSHINEGNNSIEREITRGITLMKNVIRARDKGVKFEVLWNERNQPIGDYSASFASFVGANVRRHIPITFDHWNPKDKSMDPHKEFVFKDIQSYFLNVDESRKTYVLQLAGKLHRCFRSYLTTKYLRDADGNFIEADRPTLYESLISPEEWETFVAKRNTPEFKELSVKNRKRALNPQYPYRRGRMGYARLTQKILAETKSKEKDIDKCLRWREGRVRKDGTVDESVQKVYEECVTLSQSSETSSCRDILSKALNVREYSGRVRGMGLGVTQTILNKGRKRSEKNPSTRELMAIIQNLSSEVEQLKKERGKDIASQQDMHILSDKDSSNVDVLKNIPEGISPCSLYLRSPTYRIVAKGMVHNILGDKLHHKPLPVGYLKVSIDIAFEKDAELPIPDDDADIRLVGDAIGTYVAWQRNLISLNLEIPATYKGNGNDGIRRSDESTTSKKQIQTQKLHEGTKIMKDKPINMFQAQRLKAQKLKEVTNKGGHSNIRITKPKQDIAKTKHQKPYSTNYCRPSWVFALKSLVAVQMMENTDTRHITMQESIFGEEQYHENITKEQMYEFFESTEIGVSVVCVYIRYLYEKFVRDTDFARKYSFLSPHRISLVLIEAEQELVKAYMVKEFLKYKDERKLFILPFYIHKPIAHWLLVVIDPISEIIYYLDPLLNDYMNYPKMKYMFDTVLQVFRSARNAQVSKNKFNNISWVRVQCPRQENGIDCGYFVMRFMKEILISKLNEIPKLYIDDFKCVTYSKDKLREIQEEWCQFMLTLKVI